MKWQWTALILFSLTLLPAGLAMLADRVPRRLRARLVPVRARGAAFLLIYATAPANVVPRLAGASPDTTLAFTAAGGVLAVAGALVLGVATWRTGRVS
ncbi:hypothetical protein [Streptomyces bambusae]|uniref:Integral membrane protein n=1 Tax=Streptomyces bambusae TaxID=1550616 RepID=A0ABS6YY03_9ACTN|nr:hypothetical protein [Streptomyces bambusae]MBW5480359.1 hypothetical protein [Streptomyces bambusae]